MTDQELDEIEARAAAASPGPWKLYGQHGYFMVYMEHIGRALNFDARDYEKAQDDAVFVQRAFTDVPRLVAEVRRLRAEAQDMRDALYEAQERHE